MKKAKKAVAVTKDLAIPQNTVTYYVLAEGDLVRVTAHPGEREMIDELKAGFGNAEWERSNGYREVKEIGKYDAVLVKTESLGQALLAAMKIAVKDLQDFVVEFAPEGFKENEYYEKGDEKQPFISEAYLYNLIGKDDARSVIWRVRRIERLLAGHLLAGVE